MVYPSHLKGAWRPSGVKIAKFDPRGFDMVLRQAPSVNMAILLKWKLDSIQARPGVNPRTRPFLYFKCDFYNQNVSSPLPTIS